MDPPSADAPIHIVTVTAEENPQRFVSRMRIRVNLFCYDVVPGGTEWTVTYRSNPDQVLARINLEIPLGSHDIIIPVLDHASVCLTRIAEAFASSPEKLDDLCNHGLVAQAAGLISISNSGGGQASLSTSTYTGLIRLLSTCASGSLLGAKTLLLLGISGILKDILSVSGLSVSPALTRPSEQASKEGRKVKKKQKL